MLNNNIISFISLRRLRVVLPDYIVFVVHIKSMFPSNFLKSKSVHTQNFLCVTFYQHLPTVYLERHV